MSAMVAKVTLKQDVDAEEGLIWKAEIKDWKLTGQHKTLEGVLKIMQHKIIDYLQDLFGTSRKIDAEVALASARVQFEIEVAKDRTLKEFEGGKGGGKK